LSYQGGDDPQLLGDLRAALRRWHRSTIGDVALATRLTAVGRCREANLRLTQAAALRETLLAALARQRESGWASHADLLRRRYVDGQSVHRLQQTYNLSERTIYYRLQEALVSLAHALWAMEQDEVESGLPPAAPYEPMPARWRARHLPPPTYTLLLGVQDVLDYLLRCLNRTDGDWMISVDGMGGLGKTALVREAAARVADTDRFADVAWLTIKPECYMVHDSGPQRQHALTCDQVLDGIGDQLGGLDLGPVPLTAKRERVGSLLQARPYLVVVDNLEMVTEYEGVLDSLRELSNPSKFLFTSRCRMALDAYPWTVLPLVELPEQHSLALIRGEGRLRGLHEVAHASDDALRAILAVTGGNPLAIKLVVGQLVILPLNRVLSALADARPSTDAFYDYVYAASWGLLSAPAQHLLLRLALLPATGGTWQELSAITGLADDGLASVVAELTAHSLLQSTGLEEKTYTIHPLTHAFAARQAARGATAADTVPGVRDSTA
jgi:hypothetical protein